jgi:hypothetical protein
MLVGAFDSLPCGLRDVAIEAWVPRSVAAEVGAAVGQVGRGAGYGTRTARWSGFSGREEWSGVFGQFWLLRGGGGKRQTNDAKQLRNLPAIRE